MPYPDAPAARLMYDEDGTTGVVYTLGQFGDSVDLSHEFMRRINGDGAASGFVDSARWGGDAMAYYAPPTGAVIAFRFPTPMRLRAAAIGFRKMFRSDGSGAGDLLWNLETSQNSTNGIDGDWSLIGTRDTIENLPWANKYGGWQEDPGDLVDDSRWSSPDGTLYVTPFGWSSWAERRQRWTLLSGAATRQVVWLRFTITGLTTTGSGANSTPKAHSLKMFLYGEPDTGATDDRLQITTAAGAYKPTFDFKNTEPGNTYTQTFKVKNLSTETAEGVKVDLLDSNFAIADSPSPIEWVELGDGTNWAESLDLGDLAPGASSGTLTVRVQPAHGRPGPWSPRMKITAEGWV